MEPWFDLKQGIEAQKQSPRYVTEWIPLGLGDWGRSANIPEGTSASYPYISPRENEFATGVPIFVQTCNQEVLNESNLAFAEGMQEKGVKVETYIMKNFNHDAFAVNIVDLYVR